MIRNQALMPSKQTLYQLSYLSGSRTEIQDSANFRERLRERRLKFCPVTSQKMGSIKDKQTETKENYVLYTLELEMTLTECGCISWIMSLTALVFLQSSWCSATENRSGSDSRAVWFSCREYLGNREAEAWDEQPQVTNGVVNRSGILLGSKPSKLENRKVAG